MIVATIEIEEPTSEEQAAIDSLVQAVEKAASILARAAFSAHGILQEKMPRPRTWAHHALAEALSLAELATMQCKGRA